MSLRNIQQDLRNALFIGGAAAAAYLLVVWSRLDLAQERAQERLGTNGEDAATDGSRLNVGIDQ